MGNTKVVDLGYLDAYVMRLNVNGTTQYDQTVIRNYMLDIRQRLVDAGLNDGVNWSLSRIAFNEGVYSSYYNAGHYLMVIKHLEGGVPTGDEWLISLPSAAGSRISNLYYSIGTSSTQASQYFQLLAGWSTSSEGSVLLDYNPNGNIDSWKIGAGVDFDPVTFNLRTQLPNFMPSSVKPKGSSGYSIPHTTDTCVAFVFNHTAKVVGFVISKANSTVRQFLYGGRILEPKRSADVYDGAIIYGLSSYNTLIQSAVVLTNDDLGNQIECNPYGHTFFYPGNQPYFDGNTHRFHRDRLIVRSAQYIKGTLRPDLFPQQGPYERQYLRMYQSEHGRALKINTGMCIPWADDVPPPFAGWPLVPQVPVIQVG